jgi:hypothetical protein
VFLCLKFWFVFVVPNQASLASCKKSGVNCFLKAGKVAHFASESTVTKQKSVRYTIELFHLPPVTLPCQWRNKVLIVACEQVWRSCNILTVVCHSSNYSLMGFVHHLVLKSVKRSFDWTRDDGQSPWSECFRSMNLCDRKSENIHWERKNRK